MKTALIQTTIWQDEDIFNLNIDTKLLYLFYVTAPERNCTRFYKCPDRLVSAYIGLSHNALDVCKSQLEDAGLIYFKDGWLIISDNSYIKPTKGKLSHQLFLQDLAKVPEEILLYGESLGLDCSGATPEELQEYKDNNKDKLKAVPQERIETVGVDWDRKSDVWEEAENDKNEVSFKRG